MVNDMISCSTFAFEFSPLVFSSVDLVFPVVHTVKTHDWTPKRGYCLLDAFMCLLLVYSLSNFDNSL